MTATTARKIVSQAGGTGGDRVSRPPPHATTRDGVLSGLQGARPPGDPGVHGTQEYRAHGAVYGVVAGWLLKGAGRGFLLCSPKQDFSTAP